jgi:hypothetical protein
VRVRTNPAADKALESSRETERGLRAAAERGRGYAEAIAPVDTGRYKASFHVTTGRRGNRVYARVSNDATSDDGYPYCQALEFGTSKMAAQRILQRSIDALRTTR